MSKTTSTVGSQVVINKIQFLVNVVSFAIALLLKNVDIKAVQNQIVMVLILFNVIALGMFIYTYSIQQVERPDSDKAQQVQYLLENSDSQDLQ